MDCFETMKIPVDFKVHLAVETGEYMVITCREGFDLYGPSIRFYDRVAFSR